MVSDLDPRSKYRVDGHTPQKLGRKKLNKLKSRLNTYIKKKGKGGLGLTTDMCDSKGNNSFCSLTVHFINEDFVLVSHSRY